MLDLMKDEDAYFYGLLLTDGNCHLTTRNRGNITIEISDKDIIEKISKRYYGSVSQRTRNTNFKDNSTSFIWRNSRIEFRSELISYGFIDGNKQYLQKVPNVPYNEIGFWRGVIDGNGSLGFTERNIPFLCLGTKSLFLKDSWQEFLLDRFNISKNNNRNLRDNFYNILVTTENAQKVLFYLYDNSSLRIDRKYDSYLSVMKWKRPANMKKLADKKYWNDLEDNYVISHSVEDSSDQLKRTESSIKNRVFRLRHGTN